LGFLYTLASLSVALFFIGSGRGANASIVADFGVAIFSTIAGIAARVALMQVRREADDADEELRNDFVAIATMLKDSLRRSVDDIEAFRARMGETLTREMEAVVVENAESMRRLRAETGKLVAGIEDLAERLAAAEVPPDLLARQFAMLQARVGEIADSFGRAAEADADRNRAAAGLVRELADAQVRIAEAAPFEAAVASAEALSQAVERIGAQVRDLTPALASLQQAFESHVGHGVAEAEALRRLREAMEDDLEAAQRTLRALQGAMADVADGLVRRLGP
jgi:chromosome segregation ATPase